jgi:hypothetical protein
LGVLVLGSIASITYAQNPAMVGTWVFNPAKSQEKGHTAFEVLTYELKDGAETYKVHSGQKGGPENHSEHTAKFDGIPYPGKNVGAGAVSSVSIRQMFPRVEEENIYRSVKGADGKETNELTGHYIRILSPNGKEMTSVTTDAKGDVTGVRVFDKKSDVSDSSSER